MPFQIIKGDITEFDCDAIVNAANSTLLGGGGVDGAIHKAAGPELLEECKTLGSCPTGEAKCTKAYNLPAKYVIHTVGPVWEGGNSDEKELLTSCYFNSLEIAKKLKCESIAFPLISSGVYGYPKNDALEVAKNTILSFLEENEMDVFLVLYDNGEETLKDPDTGLHMYIEKYYTGDDLRFSPQVCANFRYENYEYSMNFKKENVEPPFPLVESCSVLCDYKDEKFVVDESFSEMVIRLIDEKGMEDPECYKKANMDRKHFSKIRSNVHYQPKKKTVLALALALELSLDETEELLMKAGFAFSSSFMFDVIVKYYIENGIYDIFEINEALMAYDAETIGPRC